MGNNSQLAYDTLRWLDLWSSATFNAWIMLFPVSFCVGSDHLGVGNAGNPVLGKRCRIIQPNTPGKPQNFPFYWIRYWSTRKSFSLPTKDAFPSIFELPVEPCLVTEVHLLVGIFPSSSTCSQCFKSKKKEATDLQKVFIKMCTDMHKSSGNLHEPIKWYPMSLMSKQRGTINWYFIC